MNTLRRGFIVLLFASCTASVGGADPRPAAKQADIVRLLDVTNSLAIGQQMGAATIAQLTNALKSARPDIAPGMLDSLGLAVNAVIADSLPTFKNVMVAVYDKHFTHDEVKEMIQFYTTPLGRKLIQVMPALVQESMQAGQKWGEGLGPEIDRRVRAQLKRAGVDI